MAVNDDKATLNGTVKYWSEYDVAKNAAFNTNGVGAVVSQLNVRDYADSAAFQTGRRSFPERATISAG